MTRSDRLGTLVLAAALLPSPGCGPKPPERPKREAVAPLLQREAEAMKREGEKIDPVLRVTATWTIEGVDLTERPNDPDYPWAGTIRFKIRSQTGGPEVPVDEFSRRFDYVYSASLQRWTFQPGPSPTPTARR